MFYKFLML